MRVATSKTAAAGWMPSVEMPLLNHSVAPTNGATCSFCLRPSGHRTWVDTPSPACEGSVRSVHPRPHAQLRGAGTYGVPGPSWDNGPLCRTAAPLAAYNRASVLAAMSREVNAKPVSAPPVKEPAHASVQELQRRKSPGLWLYAGRRMRYSAHMLSEYAINVAMARRCVDGSFMILDGVIGGSLGGVSHQIARLVSGPDTPHRPSAAWNLMQSATSAPKTVKIGRAPRNVAASCGIYGALRRDFTESLRVLQRRSRMTGSIRRPLPRLAGSAVVVSLGLQIIL
jgi:hypothetical protein